MGKSRKREEVWGESLGSEAQEKRMPEDSLSGRLVAKDFWPACKNCFYFMLCKEKPKHPAFPHTWHWARDFVEFPEGDLILRSWVGTAEFGAPHSGCRSYQVAPGFLLPLQDHHRRYLELERELFALNEMLEQYEERGIYDQRVQRLYDRHQKLSQEMESLLAGKDVSCGNDV